MKKKVTSIIILALLALGCYLMGYSRAREHFRGVTKMITDTLIVRDTHVIEKPVLVDRTRKETLLVPVHDTTIVNDTVYLSLPMESKTYKGEEYLAVVSGYQPSLDRIEVYPKTMVISKTETTTLEPSPFRYSLYVGMDYGWMWRNNITPNVGIEVEYKKMSLGLECGVGLDILDKALHSPSPYSQICLKYSLVNR